MKKSLLILFIFLSILGLFALKNYLAQSPVISGAPPYYVTGENAPDMGRLFNRYSYLTSWERPEGPPRVGLQVGHMQNEEVPEELHRLRGNTGATGGGKSEWEVNYAIAMLTKELLETKGIVVDILPATVPQEYWADVFVAVHADGNPDPFMTGFKAAAPRRDFTGKAQTLTDMIDDAYGKSTGLVYDPNITGNMRGYYAFSFWKFEHAIHPMTVASILETGFLTNPADRTVIVNQPELSAQGLTTGILEYLTSEGLLI